MQCRMWQPVLVGVLALIGVATPAWAQKAESAPGWLFAQLTDSPGSDALPRASGGSPTGQSRNLITWTANYQLPEAVSIPTDFEIFLWDGVTLEQVTDDGTSSIRPVVNNFRDVAFQDGGNDGGSDIAVRAGGMCKRITQDFEKDRYPDINDNGIVVWGHETGPFFSLATYDIARDDFAIRPLAAYRPHINVGNRVEYEARWLRLPDGTFLESGPQAQDFGYGIFRRAELNDVDWMIIEADPDPPGQNAHDEGPRDILFWNGTSLRLIHSSSVWAGRGDLNRRGLMAFEGEGGLPGSTSGTTDTEIFVFDPLFDQLEQITDDDFDDEWPTVLENDTIVWTGTGGYSGATSGDADTEIFLACLDRDEDGLGDDSGYCASVAPGTRQVQIALTTIGPDATSCTFKPVSSSCGLGPELALLLPLLAGARRMRRRA